MFPHGAMPMVPVHAGPRSDRMSPKRFEATTRISRGSARSERTECRYDIRGLRRPGTSPLPRSTASRWNTIRFRSGCQLPPRPFLGSSKQDSIYADAGHHRLLNNHFALRPRENPAAYRRVFPFCVRAYYEKVDILDSRRLRRIPRARTRICTRLRADI